MEEPPTKIGGSSIRVHLFNQIDENSGKKVCVNEKVPNETISDHIKHTI
jgi:hypothetical protein